MVLKLLGYGYESNVYLIIDEKVAIIDAGTGFENANLIKEIERYAGNLDYIILTHEHFDHCGGAAALKKYFGAQIMMHAAGSDVLEKGLDIYASFFNARMERVKVDVKFDGGEIINLGETKLMVIHTPGHSPGSICLYDEKRKALFSGDTIFLYGGIGRIDFYGGNAEQLKKSIEKISKMDVKELYPGHGEYTSQDGRIHIKLALRSVNLL